MYDIYVYTHIHRSLLPAGLEHNRLALQNMLAAVGPLTSRSQSAAAIASEVSVRVHPSFIPLAVYHPISLSCM